MELTKQNLDEFTALLASRAPAPGGGGASALAAALAAALGSMVGEFTVGKPRYAAVEEEIRTYMAEAESLRLTLLGLVEEDAVAFEPLSRAYGLPKDAPGRDEILESCLRDAAAVPMKIVRAACSVIGLEEKFAEKGSTLMLSDAATGAALARGALYGAAMNVRVNTKLMKDRPYAEAMEAEMKECLALYAAKADDLFDRIFTR